MRLHVWVKNSHRLPIISQRILHGKQWILRSPMPNEHPEIHYKSRRILGTDKWGKNFSPSGSREFPSFWNLYSKSTVVQTLLQCGWWNFSPLPLQGSSEESFQFFTSTSEFPWPLLCYAAVFSVVAQSSFPQMAADNQTTFPSLCVCGLTNTPIMYKKLDNTWAAGH